MSTRLRLDLRTESGSNRLTVASIERLLVTIAEAADAAFVTLEGDTDTFCTGLDLEELVRHDTDAARGLERYAALLTAISRAPRPVVALVSGRAMGGGVGIAAAADVVLATPSATFGLPEAIFGLVPAMALPMLARRVGWPTARRLAITAETISANEAMRLGLVDEVVDDLDAAVTRYAWRLDRLDPRSVAAVRALSSIYEGAPAEYHERAAATFTDLLATDATRDRVRRFLDGETPWPGGAT